MCWPTPFGLNECSNTDVYRNILSRIYIPTKDTMHASVPRDAATASVNWFYMAVIWQYHMDIRVREPLVSTTEHCIGVIWARFQSPVRGGPSIFRGEGPSKRGAPQRGVVYLYDSGLLLASAPHACCNLFAL